MQATDHDRARDLARRARQIRRTARVGFTALAAQADVPPSTLSRWERGIGLPDPARPGWRRAAHWVAILGALDAAAVHGGPAAVVAPTHRAPCAARAEAPPPTVKTE